MSARLRSFDATKLTRVLIVAGVFITPGVFDLGAVKPFDVVKAVTVWFFAWLAFGAFVVELLNGRQRIRRFLTGYIALGFLAVTVLATLFSRARLVSIFGWYGRYNGLLTVLAYVLLFVMIATIYRRRREDVSELIYATGFGSAVLVLYIGLQYVGLDPVRWATPAQEVPGQPYFGTMGNANFAGGLLGVTFPWLFFAYRRSRRTWQRALIAFWAFAHLGTLWLTSARNGFVALGAAAVVLMFLYRDRLPAVVKIGTAIVAAALIALAALIIWHPSFQDPDIVGGESVLRSNTIKVRGHWWMAGLKMFADRPLVGTGPDTYVSEYHKYLTPAAGPYGDAHVADKPHNVFVEQAAERGIFGLVALVGLIAAVTWRALQRFRRAAERERTTLATLLAFLGAYAGQAMFSIDVTAIALTGWVALGAIAALADPPEDGGGAERLRPRRRPMPVLALVALVAIIVAAAGTAALKADHESRTAQRLMNAGATTDEVLGHHELARRWHPWEDVYPGQAGSYLEQLAPRRDAQAVQRDLLERAVEQYRDMDRLHPGYHLWKLSVGNAVTALAGVGGAAFADAERWFERARALGPYDPRVPTAYGDMLGRWAVSEPDTDRRPALLCRAQAQYRLATDLDRREADAWIGLGRTLARLGHLQDALAPIRRGIRSAEGNDAARRLLDEVERLIDAGEEQPVVECD